MGFRNYLAKISKENLENFNKLSLSDTIKALRAGELKGKNLVDLICIGGTKDGDYFSIENCTFEVIDKTNVNRLLNTDNQRFLGLTRDGLFKLIQWYREETLNFYKELISGVDTTVDIKEWDDKCIARLYHYLSNRINFWENATNNINKTKPGLINHPNFEHFIFELIHIEKTIDWDKEVLIYYGW